MSRFSLLVVCLGCSGSSLLTFVAPTWANHPFQHGTALINLDQANNGQWYWFSDPDPADLDPQQPVRTLQRGEVNLNNFDNQIEKVVTLGDGTALVNLNDQDDQWYWFNQSTLLRGTLGLDNFDGIIDQVTPLGDGTALVKTTDGAPNNQWYWFDQTTMQRGSVGLDNFDGLTVQARLQDGTALISVPSGPNTQ